METRIEAFMIVIILIQFGMFTGVDWLAYIGFGFFVAVEIADWVRGSEVKSVKITDKLKEKGK